MTYGQIKKGTLLANGGFIFQFSKKQSHLANDKFFQDALVKKSQVLDYNIELGFDRFFTDKWSSGISIMHGYYTFSDYYSKIDNLQIERVHSIKIRAFSYGTKFTTNRYFEFKPNNYFSIGGFISYFYYTSNEKSQSDFFTAVPDKSILSNNSNSFGYSIGLLPGYLKWVNSKIAIQFQLPISWSYHNRPNQNTEIINIGLSIGIKYIIK